MPTFTRVARHIQQLLDQDPANADRIRAILPPPAAEPKPAPRKRATKAVLATLKAEPDTADGSTPNTPAVA